MGKKATDRHWARDTSPVHWARGYTWKGAGGGTVTSPRKKSGKLRSFATLAGSVELFATHNSKSFSASPSPPICCCCRSLLHRLLMLLLLRVVDVSCRISGKLSAFFCVHFWIIIRLSFVVFCFSIYRMRSSSSLSFYAMLALRLVVLFWHVWFRLSFHFFSGSARFFGLWIGLFLVVFCSSLHHMRCSSLRFYAMVVLFWRVWFWLSFISFPTLQAFLACN